MGFYEVLGQKGLRAWLLSDDRLNQLQGDDATFAQVMAEAERALAGATRIAPRPRMRPEDYEPDADQPATDTAREFFNWPGAAKQLEEPPEQAGRVR